MNGASVLLRRDGVIFLRLPSALQRDCGGCSCPYCKAHPELTPRWDTLAVAERKTPGEADYSWTVHMPEVTR